MDGWMGFHFNNLALGTAFETQWKLESDRMQVTHQQSLPQPRFPPHGVHPHGAIDSLWDIDTEGNSLQINDCDKAKTSEKRTTATVRPRATELHTDPSCRPFACRKECWSAPCPCCSCCSSCCPSAVVEINAPPLPFPRKSRCSCPWASLKRHATSARTRSFRQHGDCPPTHSSHSTPSLTASHIQN